MDPASIMSNTRIYRLAVFAAVLVTVSPSPHIGKGNYVYDPNSIPQNEKILNLFIRLAAHTANQLKLLKRKSNQNPATSLLPGEAEEEFRPAADSTQKNTVRAPDPRTMDEYEKAPSSLPGDSGSQGNTEGPTILRDNLGKTTFEEATTISDDLETRDRSAHPETPTRSDLPSFLSDGAAEEAEISPDSKLVVEEPTTSAYEFGPWTQDAVRKIIESRDDLEVTESSRVGRFRMFLGHQGVTKPKNLWDSSLKVDEPTTVVYNVPWVPGPEDQRRMEVGNRALFNFEKNNYLTHYNDQSTNINSVSDSRVKNFGAGHLGNVLINQDAGSRLRGNANFRVSGQGSSASGLAGHQTAGSSDSSGNTNLGQSRTGSSASSASSNLEVNMNHNKSIMGEMSAGVNSSSYKLAGRQTSASGLNSFGQTGAKEIQSPVHSGATEFRKEVNLKLMPSGRSPSLNTGLQNSGHDQGQEISSKEGSGHNVEGSGNLKSEVGGFHGGMSTDEQGSLVQMTQELEAEEKRLQEPKLFGAESGGQDSSLGAQKFSAEKNYQGQTAAFPNSGQSSSKQALESSLNLGGQIGFGSEHGAQVFGHEKKEFGNVGHGHGAILAEANLQAGNSLAVDAGKGLATGLGLISEKVDLVKGAIRSKANFGGKLNLSAHLLTG